MQNTVLGIDLGKARTAASLSAWMVPARSSSGGVCGGTPSLVSLPRCRYAWSQWKHAAAPTIWVGLHLVDHWLDGGAPLHLAALRGARLAGADLRGADLDL